MSKSPSESPLFVILTADRTANVIVPNNADQGTVFVEDRGATADDGTLVIRAGGGHRSVCRFQSGRNVSYLASIIFFTE